MISQICNDNNVIFGIFQGPNKDKLLKDAKLLQVRKRKALADLFKTLTQVGLSYRKGMNALKDADPNRHLTAPPVNVTAMLGQLQTHRYGIMSGF